MTCGRCSVAWSSPPARHCAAAAVRERHLPRRGRQTAAAQSCPCADVAVVGAQRGPHIHYVPFTPRTAVAVKDLCGVLKGSGPLLICPACVSVLQEGGGVAKTGMHKRAGQE